MFRSGPRPRPSHLTLRSAALFLVLALVGQPVRAMVPAQATADHAVSLEPASRVAAAATRDAVRPVAGRVLRGFDPPPHPFGRGHRGVDLAAAPGDAARTVRDGRVSFAGEVAGVGWVTVEHAGGIATTYGGVVPGARVGARVAAGTPIGHLAAGRGHLDWGARWRPGGPHAYFDPLLLLADLRARLIPPVHER